MTDRTRLAALTDHTLLRPEATYEDVAALCADADELGVYAVCVSPTMIQHARKHLDGHVKVATVCGFPSGAVHTQVKAIEAALAAEQGADEVDVVMNIGWALDHEWAALEEELMLVRKSIPETVLKVIVESAVLPSSELAVVCEIVEHVGAEYIKTSTGTHPRGGATLEVVTFMRAALPDTVKIKASGGIRTAAQAVALVDAGADRLGMSATREILAELD